MRIECYEAAALDDLARLRAALWPEETEAEHRSEVEARYADPRIAIAFLAWDETGDAAGFAEATLRRDYVNGCDTSPVVFLEGIYVEPAHRRRGVARALCAAVEAWGRAFGCSELGSDAYLGNHVGHALHAALGFEERERVVCFRKLL